MTYIKEQLNLNLCTFESLLKDISEDMIYWKPKPEAWCILEIVCHLYDEEYHDFKFRTQWVLEKPNTIPPTFNPLDWVKDHDYMAQDYKHMCSIFFNERKASLQWLDSLKAANWQNAFNHPKLGTLTAKYFLTNWLAHDYLHIRQIIKLKYNFLKQQENIGLEYAGNW